MPWILDGNNLAAGGDRSRVRQAALDVARGERIRIVVVFDGPPPPGVPGVERLGGVEVRYTPDADRAILGLVGQGGRKWRVATDDRALGRQLRGIGVEVVPSAVFRERAAAVCDGTREEKAVGPESGEASFSKGITRLPDDGAVRVPRRRRLRRPS